MEDDQKRLMELRDRVKEAVIELMDADPSGGWQLAIQAIYDLRWQYTPERGDAA